MDIILKNPDLPWNWSHISENQNITWEIIIQNLDKPWDWQQLSINKFILSREELEKSRKCKAFSDSIRDDLFAIYWRPDRIVAISKGLPWGDISDHV
jgi:hypothetical protein